MKETSASLSGPSSWMLSLSDLEAPRERFMFLKYCPHRCLPASFFSLFSLARRFWNHTCERGRPAARSAPRRMRPRRPPPPPSGCPPRALTCTTRMSSPVSDESCSRTCRAGLGELL